MQQEQVEAVVQKLEDVLRRMPLWLEKPNDIDPFLNGFRAACSSCGLILDHDQAYIDIIRARGWVYLSAAGAAPSMREKGLDDTAIAQELLRIEIEALKRRYSLPDNTE